MVRRYSSESAHRCGSRTAPRSRCPTTVQRRWSGIPPVVTASGGSPLTPRTGALGVWERERLPRLPRFRSVLRSPCRRAARLCSKETPRGNSFSGAASIYGYNGTSLSAGTALTPPASPNSFGSSVAVSANGTTAIVGDPGTDPERRGDRLHVQRDDVVAWHLTHRAHRRRSISALRWRYRPAGQRRSSGTPAAARGPAGDSRLWPDSGPGEATVFTYANGSWSAGTPLVVPATAAEFGTSVALSGDGTTALVGDPTGGSGTGAVTAYSYANGAWSGGTPLPTPAGSSAFGTSVALPFTGVAAIVGDPTGGSGTGAVNVFSQSGGSWSNNGTPLAAPAGSVAFGTSVALSSGGINAIVGDPQGTPADACQAGTGPGTATVYNFAGSSWSPGTPLAAPVNSTAFGTSVALSGNGTTAAVGDPCGGPDGTEGRQSLVSSRRCPRPR